MLCYGTLPEGKFGFFEKEKPTPGRGEALIRPLILGVCTSDVHQVEFAEEYTVLGHEGIGEVVEIGEDVTDIKVGDRVIVPATTPVWKSKEVQQGISMHSNGFCGGCTLGSAKDGLMAEFALINDADMNLAILPDDIDPLKASMIGDMMSTGLSGSELAEVGFGDTVAVLGIGPLGCLAVAGAKARGAGRIIVAGHRKISFEVAKQYGATDFIDYKEENVVERIMELTGGKGVDCAISAGPGERMIHNALAVTRLGGHVANINTFAAVQDHLIGNWDAWLLGLTNKTLRGGLCPGGRLRLEQLVEMVRYDRVDPSKVITQVFDGFDKMGEAMDLMVEKAEGTLKPVVVCDKQLYDSLGLK